MNDSTPPANVGEPSAKPKRARAKAEATPAQVPEDPKSQQEKKSLFGWFSEEKNARVVELYIDIFLRFAMAFAFFWLTRGWLYGVLELLEKQTKEKMLSDGVLIALVTTTTINVLALLAAVAFYLFPRKSLTNSSLVAPPPSE